MSEFLTLIDAHVHIHNNFRINNFIKASFNNFELISKRVAYNSKYEGVLCLTESHGVSCFEYLCLNLSSLQQYKLSQTREENSLACFDSNNIKIIFIAGRQIVTLEKLEVLALGLNEDLADGKPMQEVIDYIISKNALPVIPWGAGKWIGKRKEIVDNLISKNPELFFLGDNGNRPFFWSKPGIFHKAEKKGILNLPGSDPLPFDGEEERPGNFGFYINDKLNDQKPFNDLREKIINRKNSFPTYGKLESPYRFLKNQISMQILKNKKN